MKEDNQTILDVFKKNRENGMKMLFKRYYSSLVVYAQGKIKDRGTAEDLVQNFYLRLWELQYNFRGDVVYTGIPRIPGDG